MRVGIGYDLHRLVAGRKLILCGVEIPYDKGLLGHSDADAALHAICDALLGATGLGDIGLHFPDNDQAFKGISSLELLRITHEMIRKKGYAVNNVDITILCEQPKLCGYYSTMKTTIGSTLNIPTDRVNIKATTNEGLGLIGTNEAIAAMAVATLTPDNHERPASTLQH